MVGYGKDLLVPYIITSGVLEGSILGPFLFVIFVNDLPLAVDRCNVLMYADDTVLFYTARTSEEIEITFNKELKLVKDWIVSNSLFLHRGKTECVLFGSAPRWSSVNNFSASFEGCYIKRVFEYKYLGVVMDETLSRKAQVKYVLNRTRKRLGILNRIRKNITVNTANVIYKSFILSIVDYGDIVWNCCGKVNTNSIEKLQRRAARIIMKTNSSDEALHYLKYDTLSNPY